MTYRERCYCKMILFFFIVLGCHFVASNECFNCTLLNRNGNGCAKQFDDCNECLPGYEEIKVTEGTRRISKCKSKPKLKKRVGTCNEDSDCDSDHYCFNNGCSQCFDCSVFKRFPKKGCAKQPHDCGPCLNGYLEELVTVHTSSKPCIKEKQASYSGFQQEKHQTASASVGIVAILSVSFIAVVIFVAFFFIVYKRNIGAAGVRSDVEETMIREVEESPPPSYDELLEVSSESEITTSVTQDKERTTQAIPFRNPTARYYPRTIIPHNEDEIDYADPPVVVPDDIHNEATLPSSWTPNASNTNVSEDQELCTFSGIFSNIHTTETSTNESNPVRVNNENSETASQIPATGEVVESQLFLNNAQQSDEMGEAIVN